MTLSGHLVPYNESQGGDLLVTNRRFREREPDAPVMAHDPQPRQKRVKIVVIRDQTQASR